jgi:integrase
MAKRRGNHEGSISERPNGRWLAQVRLDGNRISKSFETQRDCRAWIKQMQAQIDSGLSWGATKLTLGEYLNRWLKDIEGSVRPRTHFQYKGVVRNHLNPKLGKVKLGDLTTNQVQQLYNSLRDQSHSRRNVQLIHSVLHRALKIAAVQGIIGRNPVSAVALPKITTKEMKVLDDNQVRQLMITAAGHRYEALLHLAVTTGMRMGELLGLKWSDLDWASGTLKVQRQVQRHPGKGFVFPEPKTKAGRRVIELGQNTIRLLAAHRTRQELESNAPSWQENGLIFPSTKGTPADQRNLNRIFKELLKQAGLPEIRFHDLRHTAATLMLLNGIPVMIVSRRLGHSKPSVTLDIYGHYLPGMQKEAATLMDELVTPIAADWQLIGNSKSESH